LQGKVFLYNGKMSYKEFLMGKTVIRAIAIAVTFMMQHAPAESQPLRGPVPVSITDVQGKEVTRYVRSYALLIGAGAYTAGWPMLSGAVADIKRLKPVLEEQGFQCRLVENPTGDQLKRAYEDFINQCGLDPDNRLVLYFAGHGHTLKQSYGEDMGYIVPVDAFNPNRDLKGFLEKALDMRMVEVYALRIQSRHALFIFDSCFSGSVFAMSRAVPESISFKTANPVRQFITSGSADEQVPDRSVFSSQLIAALNGEGDMDEDGYITGSELGEFLQKKVINYSRNAQHPQYGKIRNPSLDRGDFVFTLGSRNPDNTAQELVKMYVVGEAELQENAIVSSMMRDQNGNVCAVVNIVTDLKEDISFESGAGIIKVDYTPVKISLFLSPGERIITVHMSGYEPLRIILSEYGIPRLESGQVWRMRISSGNLRGFIHR
jgi:hypothetical protein